MGPSEEEKREWASEGGRETRAKKYREREAKEQKRTAEDAMSESETRPAIEDSQLLKPGLKMPISTRAPADR